MHSQQLLEVEQLSVKTGDRDILRHLDFNLSRGEIIGICGMSGSGKTTLAWSLVGLEGPGLSVSGGFKMNGRKVVPSEVRGHIIAMIPQNPATSLNPTRRCGDQVLEMFDGTGEQGRDRLQALFADLGFEDAERIADSYPHQLSGGQLQRVVAAMAMINDPDIILADEPTTALDTIASRQLIDILLRWQQQKGRSLILISHDASMLHRVCQRVLTLSDGQLVSYEEKRATEDAPQVSRKSGGILLHVSGLSKTFKSRRGYGVAAVSNVDFEVGRGEALGLLGVSGSGKSTIARILSGLEYADGGELMLKDKVLDFSESGSRKAVQMIFQDPYSALYPHKTAEFCVAEALKLHGHYSNDAVGRLFDEVGLPRYLLHRNTRSLSGGERQRLQIARALAVEPELLICDECTTGLDPDVQQRILKLLRRLVTDRGLSILCISHDLEVVKHLCSRVLVIDEGRIVERGDTGRVIHHPEHDVTRKIMGLGTNAAPPA